MNENLEKPENTTTRSRLIYILYFLAFLLLICLCYFVYTKYFAKNEATNSNTKITQDSVIIDKYLEERLLLLQQILKLTPCSIPPIESLRNANNEELKLVLTQLEKPNIKPENKTGQKPKPIAEQVIQKSQSKNSIANIENNTVLIFTQESVGTGFIVAQGIIITNKHVVKEKNAEVIVFGKGLKEPQIAVVTAVSVGKDRDYAIIKMRQANYGPSGLALCTKAEKTEKVSAWGFPVSISITDPKFKKLLKGDLNSVPEIVYSEGVISVVHKGKPSVILHTAATSPGNSGGPLTNSDYCVVGMSTLIHMEKQSYRQTSIALGSEDIITFLKEHGVKPSNYKP